MKCLFDEFPSMSSPEELFSLTTTIITLNDSNYTIW